MIKLTALILALSMVMLLCGCMNIEASGGAEAAAQVCAAEPLEQSEEESREENPTQADDAVPVATAFTVDGDSLSVQRTRGEENHRGGAAAASSQREVPRLTRSGQNQYQQVLMALQSQNRTTAPVATVSMILVIKGVCSWYRPIQNAWNDFWAIAATPFRGMIPSFCGS